MAMQLIWTEIIKRTVGVYSSCKCCRVFLLRLIIPRFLHIMIRHFNSLFTFKCHLKSHFVQSTLAP